MKRSKLIFAFVLALALCFSGIVTAFAESPKGTPGTAAKPAEAAITKLLKTPVGTQIPETKFKFLVTSVTVDGIAATASNMPLIGTDAEKPGVVAGIVSIPFLGTESATPINGIMTIPVESDDIFAGAKGNWPHAGVYVYTVEEVPDTYTIADADHEIMNYSPAKYTLNVYVKDDAGVYYIWLIGAVVTTKDDDAQETNVKINVTPGGGDDETLEYSQMTFTNRYVHTNGGTDPKLPENATLAVSKKVEGEFGSSSIYFRYELTLKNPTITTTPALPTSYKGYVVADGQIVTTTENGAAAGNNYIDFPVDTKTEFKLKDGQSLVFINTPVGTQYDVEEFGTTAYEAELSITSNGVTESTPIVGSTLGAGVFAIGKLVGEAANKAAFKNTRGDVTPTGLNLNDIPFIGLIALALSAIAFFVVIKLRRRNNYNQANL